MAISNKIQWVRYDFNQDGEVVQIVQGGTVELVDAAGVTMSKRVKTIARPEDDDVKLSAETKALLKEKNRAQFAARALKAIAPPVEED